MEDPKQFSVIDLTRKQNDLPEGIHRFRIVDAEERPGGSGYPYIVFTLECESAEEWNGKRVWMNVSLSPAARWKLDEFLDAVEAPESGQLTAADFIGQWVKADIQYRDYTTDTGQVKRSPNVVTVMPASKSTVSQSSSLSLDDIASSSKKKSKKADTPNLPDDVTGSDEADEASY